MNLRVCFKNQLAFTIVELLVVIVVISVLAIISIVSYAGISQKAIIASLQSDLTNSSNKLKMYKALYGFYPYTAGLSSSTSWCPVAPNSDADYCLRSSPNNSYVYTSDGVTFKLSVTSNNGMTYVISDSSSPRVGLNPADWIVIGTQTWAKANLNLGAMITGATPQINNSILEKHCYNNLEANCTAYGALYQWDEAMQYVTLNGAQGICPINSHIPSDNDWKILEVQLGMTQIQADTTGWRGTDQGTQLKTGGSSGLSVPLGGNNFSGTFLNLSLDAYVWSSSESGVSAWVRNLNLTSATVYRNTSGKGNSYSVRCIAD